MPKLGFLALAVIEGGSCDIWVLRLKRYFVKRFFCGYLVSSEPYFLEDKHVFEREIYLFLHYFFASHANKKLLYQFAYLLKDKFFYSILLNG